ncbi:MAG TPA: flagellar basal body L-ring protein FlgH [Humisphaera sp.]
MSPLNRKSLACAAVLSLASTALPAAAQQQQQPAARAPQTPSGRAPVPANQPVTGQPFNLGINATTVAVQKNGGSLMRAGFATMPEQPAGPNGRRPLATSYYDIPEPEPKVIRKHDLVTIVVREESEFSVQGTTDVKRESAIEGKLDEFIRLRMKNFAIEGGGIGPNPPSVKASGNRSFKGEGTVDRTESLTTRVTAEVVDVKPNGTLVLQARKTIKTDDEVQQMVLSGTCRVEDIVADNTVLSTQMYDLRVEKTHTGAVRSATKRSWLGEILDAISPF